MTFIIRDVREQDLDGLFEVATHLDSVNLPADRARLTELITASRESFDARRDVADRRFVFVLLDSDSDRVLGTSMLLAQHGSRRAPHVYFDVLEEERYSTTLDRHVTHRILRIGYNYKGLTEIGGLVLRPELRRHPARLGKLLSWVRFMFLAANRALFREEIVSELMPPLEPDGTSLLWEALGRRFTGLSYQEADRLSHENKEFIRALFPEEPIYATLFPKEVQDVIGQVGPQTRGVEAMLRQIGFAYAHRIDPFDGGPHFRALIDDVVLVRQTTRARVDASAEPGDGAGTSLVAREQSHDGNGDRGGGAHGRRGFVALATAAELTGESVRLPGESRSTLDVRDGDHVLVLSLS